jgi:hypothetical protein
MVTHRAAARQSLRRRVASPRAAEARSSVPTPASLLRSEISLCVRSEISVSRGMQSELITRRKMPVSRNVASKNFSVSRSMQSEISVSRGMQSEISVSRGMQSEIRSREATRAVSSSMRGLREHYGQDVRGSACRSRTTEICACAVTGLPLTQRAFDSAAKCPRPSSGAQSGQ